MVSVERNQKYRERVITSWIHSSEIILNPNKRTGSVALLDYTEYNYCMYIDIYICLSEKNLNLAVEFIVLSNWLSKTCLYSI